MADEKWYFTKEQLADTPSRRCGVDADKELSYRQQAANFIQDMGQRLAVMYVLRSLMNAIQVLDRATKSQLCINTAIVYMHRYYVYHSLVQFHRNSIAAAALFLAAKVEEQPRKLEHVIKVAHMCLHRDAPALDTKSEAYLEQAADLVFNENVLLQTLGFDVAIDHPHTHVVRCCHLVKASKDLAQTSYFMASNSLHLTTMCLQYKPTVVACFCIHLACKWSNWEIPQSNEGKDWFWYVDKTVTGELLKTLTDEFLHIFDKCPSRLKRKIKSISASQSPNMSHPTITNTPFDMEPRRVLSPANADGSLSFQSGRPTHPDRPDAMDPTRRSSSMSGRTSVDYREYREKKERERMEREKAAGQSSCSLTAASGADPKHYSNHHKQPSGSSSSNSMPNKHSSSSSSSMKHPRDQHHSRQDVKSSSQMMPQRQSSGSSSSQSRDPNRDRQRLSSRDNYGVSHSAENTVESGASQDSGTVHPPEKLSNNVHKHDSRPNDLRHQRQVQMPSQKDAKPYAKYADPTLRSSSSSRKPDIFEQKSEEVRKLIEKPLPPPKPRAEQMKEDYAAMMLKSSHHPSRYSHQAEKPMPSINVSQTSALPMVDSKQLNVSQTAFTVDKSPNAPVSAAQMPQKSMSTKSSSSSSQIMPVKNGSSSSFSLPTLNNSDMTRPDSKRPRHILEQDNSVQIAPPVVKHRSLFSPEKTPTPTPLPKESLHTQKLKQKQRTSPAMPKFDMPSFSSPNSLQTTSNAEQTSSSQKQNRLSNSSSSSQKHRSISSSNINSMNDATAAAVASIEQDNKQQIMEAHSRRFVSSFSSAHEPAGLANNNRMPELVQPKESKSMMDIKPHPELIKPFDDTLNSVANQRQHKQQHHGLSNGLITNVVKHEYSTIDPNSFLVKPELPEDILSNEMPSDLMFMKDDPKLDNFNSFHDQAVFKSEMSSELDMNAAKQETFSTLKSAQSISALLQEPLPLAMPSLLQVSNYEQAQQHLQDDKIAALHMQQMQPEPSLPSTVDMSELAPPPIQCTIDVPTTTAAPVPVPTGTVPAVTTESEKKSEHRSKSEKKKEKKKHKHKDKEKSKDKHKHRHRDKDKEKEKHREKGDKSKDHKTEEGSSASSGGAAFGAEPIKITIPKDKINLSSESLGTSASSSIGSSLKIKIPKDRLKVTVPAPQPAVETEPEQAPLKIKIRTTPSSQNNSGGGTGSSNSSSRKRDRSDGHDGSSHPPAKKQQQQHPIHQQQQRPNERQNGRHSSSYNASGNDKPDRFYKAVDHNTDSGDTVEGFPARNFIQTSYGSSPQIFF